MGYWKDALSKIIHNVSLSAKGVILAESIKNKNIPKQLFKYQTFSEKKLKSLKMDSTWCACSETFNDPYDSVIPLEPNASQRNDLFKNCLILFLKKSRITFFSSSELDRICRSSKPREEYKQIVKMNTSREEYLKFKSMINGADAMEANLLKEWDHQLNHTIRKGFKISCFAENLQSMPMWYHYAEKHTGFVIEYDFTTIPTAPFYDLISGSLWPVYYSRYVFDIIPFLLHIYSNNSVNPLIGFLASTSKSDDWSYEGEWRLIVKKKPSDSDCNIKIPQPKAVYLGKDVKSTDEEKMIEISKSKHIQIFKMSLSKIEYKMEAKPIKLV